MYKVFANDVCIYNDAFALPESRAVAPKLVMEDSAAGSLMITLPKENAGYDLVERLTTDISVERAGSTIWTGRVINDQKDFWNNRVLTCEGELAFFNDSTQPPHEYANLTVRQYVSSLLAVHNSRVSANRRFTIGAVTVHDQDMPTYYTNNEKTIELLNALKERLGGHLRVRNVNGVRYLDYLEDCPKAATQTIQFGRNLIEFTRNWDSTEYATALVPLGARLDDSPIEALDAYLTVESVNSGSMYIQNASAVAAYGWIEKVVRWDDVTDPSQLLEKAKTYLTDLQFDNMQIELSALDMRYLDPSAQPVELLDEIQVISRPHGLNRLFPVTRLEIPLDEPEKSVFKLGDNIQTPLTKVNNEISTKIMQTIENLPKAHSILKEAKENADAIMSMATSGYITILQDDYGSESLAITPRPIAKNTTLNQLKATFSNSHFWYWNMNGLAHYGTYVDPEDGVKKLMLKSAITMDGAIVADFITAGTMSADRVRTGLLKDIYGNVEFDLTNGTLSMKKGYILLGNAFMVDSSGNLAVGNIEYSMGKNSTATVNRGDFMVDKNGNVSITKGYIKLGSNTVKFMVDVDGNMGVGTVVASTENKVSSAVFKVANDGTLTMTRGSIKLGSNPVNFMVDEDGNLAVGNVSYNKTSNKIASGVFMVTKDGVLSLTKGSIKLGSNFMVDEDGNLGIGSVTTDQNKVKTAVFKVTKAGLVTMTRGSIELGTTTVTEGGVTTTVPVFKVDDSGDITMRKGSITLGTMWVTENGAATKVPAFKVDNDGNVTIRNGSITIGSNFKVTNSGDLTATNGTFSGTVKASKFVGAFSGTQDDQGNDAWLEGCGIRIGKNASAIKGYNFYVDSSGNVWMNGTLNTAGDITLGGSIKLSGSITWSSSSSPVCILYAASALNTPTGAYNDYPLSSSYGWHKTIGYYDYYASYSYDGGQSWTTAIKIKGTDGVNGQDGRDGSDATVTRQNIVMAMLNATTQDGLYSYSDGWNTYLGIRATAIKAGAINADEVTLSCTYGGFGKGLGRDDNGITTGAKIWGSGTPYMIVTGSGCRLEGQSASLSVSSNITGSSEYKVSSDRRMKNSISYTMDQYDRFFMALKPARFKYNHDPSGNLHTGFIAQDVEEALLAAGLDYKDFDALTRTLIEEPDENGITGYRYTLAYEGFTALAVHMIQKLCRRVERLEAYNQ